MTNSMSGTMTGYGARSVTARDVGGPARRFGRRMIALSTVAVLALVIALIDRIVTSPGADAVPLSTIALAGLAAAAVSTMLRRITRRTL